MSVNLTLPTITAQELKLPAVDPINLTVNIVFESAPVITGVPTISGTAKVGQTLTATAASVSGVPTPTDSFQWQRSDNGTTGWADISGATNTTYTAVTADENKYLRVVQTSTNVAGSDSANSASTAQVAAAFTGLLDTYSGAAAAYSLRLLRSDYSGSAIKVRRSDDNEEQDIGFRNNELDTSTLETFSIGSDCFITTWYDQSGNTINATNSTAANQPKIVSSGTTITENGKPAIEYDGSGDQLQLGSAIDLSNQFFLPLVYKSNRTSSEDYVLYGDEGSSRIRLYQGLYRLYIDNVTYGFSTANDNFGTQYLFTNEADSSRNLSVYRNSSQIGSSESVPIGDNWIIEYLGYGSSRPITGLLQEVVIYASNQSSNRSGIETNINDFYSIYTP
jgi:hypothetical protein